MPGRSLEPRSTLRRRALLGFPTPILRVSTRERFLRGHHFAARHDDGVPVLAAISFCHLLNDMMQSLLPAIYPMLKENYALDFGQIGLITFTYQVTASLLQPVVGVYTDQRPKPYSLAVGMGVHARRACCCCRARTATPCCCSPPRWSASARRSSIPSRRASRAWRRAGGTGLAQSLFQVGGNAGSAIGPLLAAFVVLPRGQASVAWFALAALARRSCCCSASAAGTRQHGWRACARKRRARRGCTAVARGSVGRRSAILLALIFSKYFYLASLTSYYTFYLIERFDVSVRSAQLHLFVFLARSRSARSSAGRSAIASAASPSSGSRSSACCRSRWRCRTRTCSGPAC